MIDRDSRIKVFGSESDWENPADAEVAHGTGAIDLDHHMQPLRLSIAAINQASKIIPYDVYKQRGLCTWLQAAAEHYFARLPSEKLEYLDVKSTVRYIYEFDAKGPVLKGVRVG